MNAVLNSVCQILWILKAVNIKDFISKTLIGLLFNPISSWRMTTFELGIQLKHFLFYFILNYIFKQNYLDLNLE